MRTRKEILLHISQHHYNDADWEKICQTPMLNMGRILSQDFPEESAESFFTWMNEREIDRTRIKEVAKIDKYLSNHYFTDNDWETVRAFLYSKFPNTLFERPYGQHYVSANNFKIWQQGYLRTEEEVTNFLLSHSFDEWNWNIIKKFCVREYGKVLVHFSPNKDHHTTLKEFSSFVGKKVI